MSAPQRTPAGKWIIWNVSTGEQIERWPVDARLMLASGEFAAEPPDGGARQAIAAPSEPPREHPSAAALLTEPRLPPEIEAVVGPTNVVRSDVAPTAAPVTLPASAPRRPGRPRKAK